MLLVRGHRDASKRSRGEPVGGYFWKERRDDRGHDVHKKDNRRKLEHHQTRGKNQMSVGRQTLGPEQILIHR